MGELTEDNNIPIDYLLAQEEFIEGMAESQRDAVIAIRMDGCISYINYSAAELLNVYLTDIEGEIYSNLFSMVCEHNLQQLQTVIQDCLDTAQSVSLSNDTALLKHDDTLLPVGGYVTPWRNLASKQIGVLLTLRKASSTRLLYSWLARH